MNPKTIRLLSVTLFAGSVLSLAACQQPQTSNAANDSAPSSDAEKLGYALGVDVATNLREQVGDEFDDAALLHGIRDKLSGTNLDLDETARLDVKRQAAERIRSKREAEAASASSKNADEGKAYLAENAKRDGVTVTASGLQYETLTAKEGAKPKASDTVTVHYKGTLIDGTEFDSSYSRGQPASFPLGGVIPGWTEGLQLMNVGEKFRFVIPSELAYGERGAGGKIGPHSTLVFEVELLEIKG